MNTEDDEFNRIEREAKQRMEAVKNAIGSRMRDATPVAFNLDWNNFHDGVAVGRTTAFKEIRTKIAAMPFNDTTIDSLLVWLKEQE